MKLLATMNCETGSHYVQGIAWSRAAARRRPWNTVSATLRGEVLRQARRHVLDHAFGAPNDLVDHGLGILAKTAEHAQGIEVPALDVLDVIVVVFPLHGHGYFCLVPGPLALPRAFDRPDRHDDVEQGPPIASPGQALQAEVLGMAARCCQHPKRNCMATKVRRASALLTEFMSTGAIQARRLRAPRHAC